MATHGIKNARNPEPIVVSDDDDEEIEKPEGRLTKLTKVVDDLAAVILEKKKRSMNKK